MISAPTEDDLCNIVVSTHAADRIQLTLDETKRTWKREIQNPYAHGHFQALMYILHTLRTSNDFPVKEPSLLTDMQRSHAALDWLRTIHTKMMEPLVNSPLLEDDPNGPQSFHVGQYRFQPTTAITRPAPQPAIIPAIMHNWIKDIGLYHQSIKGKVENPYGFNPSDAKELLNRVKEIPIFFSIVQPFGYGNQRLGRLVEIAFRWKWNIPLVHYWPNTNEHHKLLERLAQYETDKLGLLQNSVQGIK